MKKVLVGVSLILMTVVLFSGCAPAAAPAAPPAAPDPSKEGVLVGVTEVDGNGGLA